MSAGARRLALAAALLAAPGRVPAQHAAHPPANWVHASPGCIQGSNLVLHTGIATIEECLQLCLAEPDCVGAGFPRSMFTIVESLVDPCCRPNLA